MRRIGHTDYIKLSCIQNSTDSRTRRPHEICGLAHETQRLRGEKSADHVGAGRSCSEHVGLEYLEPLAPLVGLGNGEVHVLSTAKSGLV